MKFLYFEFVVLAAILLAVNLNAETPELLAKLSEIGKLSTGPKFQMMLEHELMTKSDNNSKAALEAMIDIRTEALKRQSDPSAQAAMDGVIKSILFAVRLVGISERLAENELDPDMSRIAKDPEGSIETLRKSMQSIGNSVFTFAIPIQVGYGAALALAGGANQKQLENSMTAIQGGESSYLEAIKIAEELAVTGMKAGGVAAVDGFKAARGVVESAATVAYEFGRQSARYALQDALIPVWDEDVRASGIIESLKTNISIECPNGIAAVHALEEHLNTKSSSKNFNKALLNAAKIVAQALIATISETANAVSMGRKAMTQAEELAAIDKQAAISRVQEAINKIKEKIIHAASYAFLGLGAAAKICDSENDAQEKLYGPMVVVVMGRTQAYNIFNLAELTSISGIRAGGIALPQGIKAAMEICDAAGSALYAQFVLAGKQGIDVFLGA